MTVIDFTRRFERVSRRMLAATLALLSLLAGSAWAATFNAGALIAGQNFSFDNPVGIGAGLAAPGAAFSDSVTFSLASPLGLNSQVDLTDLPGDALLSNVAVNLFANGNPVALFQGTNGASAGGLITNAFAAAALAPGNYALVISGFGSGTFGGSYFGSITAVPALAVPEAPAWMSMLAGLALLGTLASRRLRAVPAGPTVAPARPLRTGLHPDTT